MHSRLEVIDGRTAVIIPARQFRPDFAIEDIGEILERWFQSQHLSLPR